MAVESRFVVIRHGAEVQTFMDKKSADEYDKMLDMADNLTAMLESTPFDLSEETKEDLSIYLAQNREDVLVALQAKKAKPATIKATHKLAESKVAEPKKQATKIEAEPKKPNETLIKVEPIKEKAAPKKRTKTKTASDIANSPAAK